MVARDIRTGPGFHKMASLRHGCKSSHDVGTELDYSTVENIPVDVVYKMSLLSILNSSISLNSLKPLFCNYGYCFSGKFVQLSPVS